MGQVKETFLNNREYDYRMEEGLEPYHYTDEDYTNMRHLLEVHYTIKLKDSIKNEDLRDTLLCEVTQACDNYSNETVLEMFNDEIGEYIV